MQHCSLALLMILAAACRGTASDSGVDLGPRDGAADTSLPWPDTGPARDASPPPADSSPADSSSDAPPPVLDGSVDAGDSGTTDAEPAPCTFDTRTFVTYSGSGYLVESITAYGKYWNFDADDGYALLPGSNSDLTSVARYAAGPCAGKAAGTCAFDTRTFVTDSGSGHLVESITAYGKYWNFDADDGHTLLAGSGNDLTSVARYGAGPCAGKAAGTCTFDTRTFVIDPDSGHRIESITAYGKYWNFDADDGHTPLAGSGSDLTSVARYAAGPCTGKAAGTCTFDTRTFVIDPGSGHLIESITAYGKYWNFDADDGHALLAGSNSDLTSVARYAANPCQ